MADLKVERVGGLAGYGSPQSRIQSRGTLALDDLSAKDRTQLTQLFEGSKRRARPKPDEFVYRITREGKSGPVTVEVPESAAPEAIIRCVKDELI